MIYFGLVMMRRVVWEPFSQRVAAAEKQQKVLHEKHLGASGRKPPKGN